MLHDDGFALLIGIDDYAAFDRSTGRAEGTSDLQGSLNDAHVFWRKCTEMGMRPEHIRILTSPRAELADVPGATAANLGDATEKGILDAVRWLADRLAGGAAGLLTYSGHGAYTSRKGLLLCPSDVAGADFDHAIPLAKLRGLLGDSARNLTMVLDCCHAGVAEAGDARARRVTTLGGDMVPAGHRREDVLPDARVLAACRPDQLAQQSSFSGRPRGAFSWAVSSVLDQWRLVPQGDNVRIDLSYGTLVDRARQLLAVLGFAQTPELHGPPGVEALSVLQVGDKPLPVSAEPDGVRELKQLDGGSRSYLLYQLTYVRAGGGTGGDATVLVANTQYVYQGRTGARYTFSAGKEAWDVDSLLSTTGGNIQGATAGATLTFAPGAPQDWPASGPVPGFSNVTTATMTAAPSWSASSAPTKVFYASNVSGSPIVAVSFANMSWDATRRTYLGSPDWYVCAPSAPSSAVIPATAATTLTYGTPPAAPSGCTWWQADVVRTKYYGS